MIAPRVCRPIVQAWLDAYLWRLAWRDLASAHVYSSKNAS